MNNERTIVFCFRATPPKKHTKSELAKMTKAELIKKVMMLENVRNDWREGIIELQDILHDTEEKLDKKERQLQNTSDALWIQTKNLLEEQSKRQ